jgi:hypothetical protein
LIWVKVIRQRPATIQQTIEVDHVSTVCHHPDRGQSP